MLEKIFGSKNTKVEVKKQEPEEVAKFRNAINVAFYDSEIKNENHNPEFAEKLKKEINEYESKNSQKPETPDQDEVKTDDKQSANTKVNEVNNDKKDDMIKNPLVDFSIIADKWNENNIKSFNEYMISVRQSIDNENINSLVKTDFMNLKLLSIKFSKNKNTKNDLTCVLINNSTHSVFELFRVNNHTEITEYDNQFEYKSEYYKRLSKANKMPKDKRLEYLNGYCRVDFKLFPKE